MRAEKWQVGLVLTLTVETTEKEQSLHFTNEILAFLKHVSSMDKNAIAEEHGMLTVLVFQMWDTHNYL